MRNPLALDSSRMPLECTCCTVSTKSMWNSALYHRANSHFLFLQTWWPCVAYRAWKTDEIVLNLTSHWCHFFGSKILFMVLPLLRLEVVDIVKHMRPRHTSHSKGVSQGPRAIPLDDVSVERLAFSKEMGSTACKAPPKTACHTPSDRCQNLTYKKIYIYYVSYHCCYWYHYIKLGIWMRVWYIYIHIYIRINIFGEVDR